MLRQLFNQLQYNFVFGNKIVIMEMFIKFPSIKIIIIILRSFDVAVLAVFVVIIAGVTINIITVIIMELAINYFTNFLRDFYYYSYRKVIS